MNTHGHQALSFHSTTNHIFNYPIRIISLHYRQVPIVAVHSLINQQYSQLPIVVWTKLVLNLMVKNMITKLNQIVFIQHMNLCFRFTWVFTISPR